MIKTCPDPVDVQDLQFKLHCKLKVFNNKELDTFAKPYSLISCASRYGLLFVGSNTFNLQVIQLKCVENYTPKDKDISGYPRRNVALPSRPQHICVNCDSTILAVVTERDNCCIVLFYDVLSFFKQNISVIKEARLSSTPGVFVTEIGWNPALPAIFTACKSDGTLGVYEIKDNSLSINELPAASEATCFCWSPKGKQIAVGSRNSQITQYKPDLKAVKVINKPPLKEAHSLISLQWVSNYQFIGIYQSADPEGAAKLVVVDAPKAGESTFTNYEDVCYSGTSRLAQFYMIFQQHWNLIMVASSNSAELGVLSNSGEVWTQWIISDSARAELPLSTDHQETLPVGLALDVSSTRCLPWNESTIPPCPYLLILSHHGVLCLFDVINLKEGVPSLCTPPDLVSDLSGVQQFITPSENISAPQPSAPPKTIPLPQTPPVNQTSVFGAKIFSQPPPSFTASLPVFKASSGDSIPALSSQITLTPIKPQQPTTQPVVLSQPLITPVTKQQTSAPSGVNFADKYSSIFSAVNAPAVLPPAVESKPVLVPQLNLSKPLPPTIEQVVQPEVNKPPAKASDSSKTAQSLKVEETDALLAQMLKDECVSLESELKAILHQGKLLKVDVGSDSEKTSLINEIDLLQEFIKEIMDISVGENAEVHYLKQNMIQSWAWFEEARSRYNASKDETVSLLIRSQPLDSATEKKQADIRKMMYYIESQISQASKALDEQWDNFQDYAKKVYRTKMPTMEAIFQAMVRQNGILQKQSYILKDIANILKSRVHGFNAPSLLLHVGSAKDLDERFSDLKIDQPDELYRKQYERVVNRKKNLSEAKRNKLRTLLRGREILHVTTVKAQLGSSLMLQSPQSKTKRLLSNLAALAVSPSVTTTKPVPKALSFVHSTPIRDAKHEIKPTETPPNTPQVEAKPFTFKKLEKNAIPTSNSFIPLSKSASVFSNLPQEGITQASLPTHTPSAFVPTQINLGSTSGKFFNFSSTPTVAATEKLQTPTTTLAPTFSFTATSSALPKFAESATPKASEASKPSFSQFHFGSAISITPVQSSTNVKVTATNASLFGTAASTTKSSFNFSGNIFGASAVPVTSSTSQTSMKTLSNNLFANLSQPVKPSSGSSAVIPTGSKLSAFSAVTTSTTSITSPVMTANLTTKVMDSVTTSLGSASVADTGKFTSNTALFESTSAASVSKPTISFSSISVKDTPAIEKASVPVTSVVTTASVVTTKPLSTIQISADAAVTTSTSAFSVPTFVKQTLASSTFAPSVTSVSTTVSSAPVQLIIASAASTKTPLTIPFTVTKTSNISTPLFGTNAPSSIVKPSVSDKTAATTPSVFGDGTVSSSGTTTSIEQPVFGTAVTASQPSIFGTNQSSSTSAISTSVFDSLKTVPTTQPTFGASASSTSSIFSTTQNVASESNTTQSSSVFSFVKTTTNQPSIFSAPTSVTQNPTSVTTNTTQSTSIFGSAKTTASVQPSMFGSGSISTKPSVFGTTQTSTPTTAAGAVFGQVSSTQGSVFGASSMNSSIFGASTTPKTTASIFGGSPNITTQSSVFAKPSVTSSSSPSSIFGANAMPASQPGSIFGSGGSPNASQTFGSVAAQPSIFGGTTTKPPTFGAPQTSTTQSSIFATTTTPSSQTSIFGMPSTTSTFGQASPFGQTSSMFGTPKTTASTFGTSPVFGSTPSTSPSVFGQSAPFGSTSANAFDTSTTNIFGSASSTFGTSTSSNTFGSAVNPSSFSFAGAASNAGGGSGGNFGFGSLNVGSPATTNSVFGGSATFGQASTANPFGRTTEQKSPFGEGSTSNIFGTPASSSSSVFGSNAGSAFSGNTQSGFGTSTFGSPSAFGQQSTFGQSSFGNTSFGNVQPGPFSSGSGAGAQAGFGSPPNFPKQPGFGSAPVFGGSPQPAFGAAPSFGGAPIFGATPAFGSPNKIFGGSPTSAGFGSASNASVGFGSLANQNTVGFGSLAQQATSTSSTPFSGSSSFSSWR